MGNHCQGSSEPESDYVEPTSPKLEDAGAQKSRNHLVYKRPSEEPEFVSPNEERDDIDDFFGLEPVQAAPKRAAPVAATEPRVAAETAPSALKENIAAAEAATAPSEVPEAELATQQATEPAVAQNQLANVTTTEAEQESSGGDQPYVAKSRLSEKSLHTLGRLRQFESDFAEISADLVRLGAELGDPSVTRATGSRAFDELAQLEARLDTLQFKGVDSVETVDLQSGKEESRALRKKLTQRAESLHEELDVLLRRADELRKTTNSFREKIFLDCANVFPKLSGEYKKQTGDGLNGRALWQKQGSEAVLYCNPKGKYCLASSKDSALKNLSNIRASEPSNAEQPWEVKAWLAMCKTENKFIFDPAIKVRQLTAPCSES